MFAKQSKKLLNFNYFVCNGKPFEDFNINWSADEWVAHIFR